jgi:hypothetical protein
MSKKRPQEAHHAQFDDKVVDHFLKHLHAVTQSFLA